MKRLILLFSLLSLAFSCEDKPDVNTGDCPPNIACTEIFVSIAAQIKDGDGKPYSLDEYYTTKLETGEKISYQTSDSQETARRYGSYPILADGQMAKTMRAGLEFEFTGIKDGKESVKRKFVIGHDCCHVKLLSGDTKITIK